MMREWKVGDLINITEVRPTEREPAGLLRFVSSEALAFAFGIVTGASFVTWLFRY